MVVAALLQGAPVVKDIKKWCRRKGHRDGVEPVMAVVFFNTDAAAVDYVRIKANIAKLAGVGYWVYEMPLDASNAVVKAQVQALNKHPDIHGILIQRPLPDHLDEPKIMASMLPVKNIEEYCRGETDDIAADALTRLLVKYKRYDLARRSTIHIAGFGNIITDGFIAHMRRSYPSVSFSPRLPTLEDDEKHADGRRANTSVLVTELNRGPGFITRDKIRKDVRVIIDLGFYVSDEGIVVGDVDHRVYQDKGLAIAPTPGGLLPILLWLMMERTIKAKQVLVGDQDSGGGCICQ